MSNNPSMSEDLKRVNNKEMTTQEFIRKYMPLVALREDIRASEGDDVADQWYEQIGGE